MDSSLSSTSDVAADNICSSVNSNNSITSSSGSPESRDGLSYSGSAVETPTTDLGYPLKGSPAVMLENTPKIEGIRLAVALDIIRSTPHATLLELNQHYKDLHDACTRTRGAYDIVHNAYLTLRDAYNLALVECNAVQDKYRQTKSAYMELARTAPHAIPLTSNPFHIQVPESAELPPWPAPASSQSTPSFSLLSGSVPIPSHTAQPSSLSSTSAAPASKEPVKPKLADSSALSPSSKSIAESSQSAQQKRAVSSLLPYLSLLLNYASRIIQRFNSGHEAIGHPSPITAPDTAKERPPRACPGIWRTKTATP
ncbi:hypothetical protein A0H81_00631 [Grifola frondosa]|uniref:Uncharacterized protein n=1 Tax=Grifola frondosa TaxID=5627 RepID=A0A1C7MRV4_GRIFR|nr:hypothetical protein A0H81_00631 [Grifola frondosa]